MQFIYFLYKIFYDTINDIQFNATQKLSTMSIEKAVSIVLETYSNLFMKASILHHRPFAGLFKEVCSFLNMKD